MKVRALYLDERPFGHQKNDHFRGVVIDGDDRTAIANFFDEPGVHDGHNLHGNSMFTRSDGIIVAVFCTTTQDYRGRARGVSYRHEDSSYPQSHEGAYIIIGVDPHRYRNASLTYEDLEEIHGRMRWDVS